MGSKRGCALLALLASVLICGLGLVKCDEEDTLLQGINTYRGSLNLTALTTNKNAECLAEEIANQFENQPCTNTTGSNTVPGTEPNFASYPDLLTKCHLNITNTREGVILPACVPNLDRNLLLSNYTQSQYSRYLNDSSFTGAGLGSEGNWMVVVLATSTPDGSFTPADGSGSNGASLVQSAGLVHWLLLLVWSFLMV
uniref:Uncharacterized GPI-anchored protein At5g19230-like domain-containing protein n=1 Tax=Kalanchoe fedtschenkoi TaxID=63787 RepID=A0A7N0SYR0_KALFE